MDSSAGHVVLWTEICTTNRPGQVQYYSLEITTLTLSRPTRCANNSLPADALCGTTNLIWPVGPSNCSQAPERPEVLTITTQHTRQGTFSVHLRSESAAAPFHCRRHSWGHCVKNLEVDEKKNKNKRVMASK